MITEKDLNKIVAHLKSIAIKDTDLFTASLPFKGDEEVAIIQNGRNTRTKITNLIGDSSSNSILNLSENLGFKFNLTEALKAVTSNNKKLGLILTFIDKDTDTWAIYQYSGKTLEDWYKEDLWINLYNKNSVLDIDIIYKKCIENISTSGYKYDIENKNEDNFIPEGWSKTPLSPSTEYPYIIVSTRQKINNVWNNFSEPVIWSYYTKDGKTSYIHIAYANSENGDTDFSLVDATNRDYLGQYVDFNVKGSENYLDYKWSKIKGNKGDNAISIQIVSSNGNAFRTGNANTTLSCYVFSGSVDITDTIDSSKFRWYRKSGSTTLEDSIWNNSYKAVGKKQIYLTPEDVIQRTVFRCEVDI